VADFRQRIDELAQLMDEFHLAEARLESDDLTVAFRRRPARAFLETSAQASEPEPTEYAVHSPSPPVFEEPIAGTPVPSPMAGIFYGAPSPGSAPFVKEGDEVSAGQIIGLIEAMKVFNEIPCPISGIVLKLAAEPGSIVQPGDALIIVT
jgi:acetyl-CoA carboxylase biotin carboxyl carrier protein